MRPCFSSSINSAVVIESGGSMINSFGQHSSSTITNTSRKYTMRELWNPRGWQKDHLDEHCGYLSYFEIAGYGESSFGWNSGNCELEWRKCLVDGQVRMRSDIVDRRIGRHVQWVRTWRDEEFETERRNWEEHLIVITERMYFQHPSSKPSFKLRGLRSAITEVRGLASPVWIFSIFDTPDFPSGSHVSRVWKRKRLTRVFGCFRASHEHGNCNP